MIALRNGWCSGCSPSAGHAGDVGLWGVRCGLVRSGSGSVVVVEFCGASKHALALVPSSAAQRPSLVHPVVVAPEVWWVGAGLWGGGGVWRGVPGRYFGEHRSQVRTEVPSAPPAGSCTVVTRPFMENHRSWMPSPALWLSLSLVHLLQRVASISQVVDDNTAPDRAEQRHAMNTGAAHGIPQHQKASPTARAATMQAWRTTSATESPTPSTV